MIVFRAVVERLPMMHSRIIEVRAILHLSPLQARALGSDFAQSFAAMEMSAGKIGDGVQIAMIRIGIFNPPKDSRRKEYWQEIIKRDTDSMTHHPRRKFVPLMVMALGRNSARIQAQEILIGSPHHREANETLHVLSYESDPYVDRGFILAMMMSHIASVTRSGSVLVYQPISEADVPEDQKGRIGEVFDTVKAMRKTLGYEVIAADTLKFTEDVASGVSSGKDRAMQRASMKEFPFLMAILDCDAIPGISMDIGPRALIQAMDISDWLTARTRKKA